MMYFWNGMLIGRCVVIAFASVLTLGIHNGHGQDVAEPEMPNVDLETAEGRQVFERKNAVVRFLALMMLNSRLGSNDLPEDALNNCPEEFQQFFRKGRDYAEMSEEEQKKFQEQSILIFEKYAVNQILSDMMFWISREMNSDVFSGVVPDFENVVKQEYGRLKKSIEAGTIIIPSLDELRALRRAAGN